METVKWKTQRLLLMAAASVLILTGCSRITEAAGTTNTAAAGEAVLTAAALEQQKDTGAPLEPVAPMAESLGLYQLGEILVDETGEPVLETQGRSVHFLTDGTTGCVPYVALVDGDGSFSVYALDGAQLCADLAGFTGDVCYGGLYETKDGQVIDLETGDVVLAEVSAAARSDKAAVWISGGAGWTTRVTAASAAEQSGGPYCLLTGTDGTRQILDAAGNPVAVALPEGECDIWGNYLTYKTQENTANVIDISTGQVVMQSNAGTVIMVCENSAVLETGEGQVLYAWDGDPLSDTYQLIRMLAPENQDQLRQIALPEGTAALLLGHKTGGGFVWMDQDGTIVLEGDGSDVAGLLNGERLYLWDSANQIVYLSTLDGTLLARMEGCTWAQALPSLNYDADGVCYLLVENESAGTQMLLDSNGNVLVSGEFCISSADGSRIVAQTETSWLLLDTDGNLICEIGEA